MVINKLNVGGSARTPGETDPPLIVDPNAVLADTVAGQFLEAVAWRHAKVIDVLCGVEQNQLVVRGPAHLRAQSPDMPAMPDRLGVLASEGPDHHAIVTLVVINGKRYYRQGSLKPLPHVLRRANGAKPYYPDTDTTETALDAKLNALLDHLAVPTALTSPGASR